MVVLDAVHQIQAEQRQRSGRALELQGGKCGSCSAEVNGKPRLMCMTRLNELPLDEPVTVEPMRAFPPIRDLVTDVSWNFRGQEDDQEVQAAPARRARRHLADRSRRTSTACRSSASASSASSARTSATCCAITTCTTSSSARGCWSTRRRWRCIRSTPRTALGDCKDDHGIGYCNITKCCTKVCPESITITDNAIIPLKERVVDEFYDPLKRLFRVFRE